MIYDALAQQYEARVEARREETAQVADVMIRYSPPGAMLDVGCGVGLLVSLLRDHGVMCTGMDASEQMVDFARRRNGEEAIIHADFLEYDFDGREYAAVAALAFIHLFRLPTAQYVVSKIHRLLVPGGLLYIGTTKSEVASEGLEPKHDYTGGGERYRKRWTLRDFHAFLTASGFEVVDILEVHDPFGKVWMDFIARRPVDETTPVNRS